MSRINAHRRRVLGTSVAVLTIASAVPLLAQSTAPWPSRSITMVLPYPPGGLGDAVARRLAQRLTEMWSVSVVVDNKPGAAGAIGAGLVAKAPADGYTMMYTIPETLSISKAAKLPLGFDPVNDFQPIAMSAMSSTVLTVPADSPHKTFRDFMEFARKNPGKLNFGVQGVGSTFHLALEQLKSVAGVDIMAVPYKGAAPAVTDLLAGRLDGMIVSTSVTIPHIQSGKLRVIAIASKDRVPLMPDIPTIAESGYPGYDNPVALAVFVRAGTPQAIVDRMAADIRLAMNEKPMVDWLASLHTVTSTMTPDEFKARIQREVQTYAQLIEKAGIKFE